MNDEGVVVGEKRTMKNWKVLCFWIGLSEAVGVVAGLLTRKDVQIYSSEIVKPLLSPPPVLFPVVWTVLYALMGHGAARNFMTSAPKGRTRALWFFGVQLFLNFGWCFIFFSSQSFGAAFLWLLALIVAVVGMFLTFHKIDKVAAYTQTAYLLWLLFAAYLNFSVWLLN